ncbi:MAG: A/G-specific adenine glycosylase [Hyphomicrobiales bacterium]|nr:A/G-specific adenine glycosylase [Hyphomicrobiales bacterium]MDE2114929.1 A/G-specific adenine glycosylase [Hyphomicrobiales bacterium]
MLNAPQTFATPTQRVLDWYGQAHRKLPWRAPPGQLAEPYRVWLSEIMLQQTNVATATPYYFNFLQKWPDVAALARAEPEAIMQAWAGLGYYSRARNLHACAQLICAEHGGEFPRREAQLLKLPGIGPYTAAAIAAMAFGASAVVVDGNIERIMTRMFALEAPLPKAKPEIRSHMASLTPARHAGDFAQALMDIGATLCAVKSPNCTACPLQADCLAAKAGNAATYPRRAEKVTRPHRQGHVYIAQKLDGSVLVQTNGPRGLFGGMTCLPHSGWATKDAQGQALPPLPLAWQELKGEVTHVFTHFSLSLTVHSGQAADMAAPNGMRWVGLAQLEFEALPSLMRKVLAKWRESQ